MSFNKKQNSNNINHLFITFFKEDKINFIGYIFTLTITAYYIIWQKNYNLNIAIIDLMVFYFFSLGFIYHGIKFINSNQSYITQYYKMEKDTFIYLYFNYTKYPQQFLELYYSIKTFLLFLPLIGFLFF